MDVESRRSFQYGFILKETDLRRLVDLTLQQFEKLADRKLLPPEFRMKFRNGVIAKTNSIDEVLTQENSGSGQIVRLGFSQITDEQPPSRIVLEFINADEDDEPGYVSLRYHVFGHNRDWVFVTSSLLEERFEKIKRFALNQLGKHGPSRFLTLFFIPIVLMLVFAGSLSTTSRSPKPSLKLEEALASGQIRDPVQAFILIEKEKEKRDDQLAFQTLGRPLGLVAALMLLLVMTWAFFYKYYPVYNFCWGEYVEEFKKKESVRKFWLVIVAIGLFLSFLGSLLANKIHW